MVTFGPYASVSAESVNLGNCPDALLLPVMYNTSEELSRLPYIPSDKPLTERVHEWMSYIEVLVGQDHISPFVPFST